MKTHGPTPLLAIALPLALAAGCTHEPPTPEPPAAVQPQAAAFPGDLVVHEWGTFTSLAGSEGTSLDGLHHASDALPAFVHNVGPAARRSPFAAYGDSSTYVPALNVNGKMETPVLYFYSAQAQRVRVHVDFPNGLLTEWYPGASAVAPAPAQLAGGALDLAAIDASSLDWDLEITPFAPDAPDGVPEVEHDDPWQFAREVRAGFVRPVLPGGARSAEAEHYVFYRGLGRLQLPILLRFDGGELAAYNVGDAPIAAAFALEMHESSGRFAALGRFAGAERKAVTFSDEPAPKERVVAALEREVLGALVAEGLYEDEARAMVRTWSPTWFAAEGTRVLYVLPRATTDAMLPIQITPRPRELVRVLVGRQDILTPQVEAEVALSLAERAARDPARREAALRRLARLGRFLEPAVRRAVRWTSSDVVRKSGEELLAQFQ